MKPLQAVAMGYVFIALHARQRGFDLYADPFGWLLILWGLGRLPHDYPSRRALVGAATLAFSVSVPLWIPAVVAWFADAEPALGWAVNLPGLLFMALLAQVLGRAALREGDLRPARWFALLLTITALVAVAPVLIFGLGWDAIGPPSVAALQVTHLAVIGLLFWYSGRAWAGAPAAADAEAD